MAEECIAHICKVCGSAFKTRDSAKKHVSRRHGEKVSRIYGPGPHVKYLWLDLKSWRSPCAISTPGSATAANSVLKLAKATLSVMPAAGESNTPTAP